MAEHFNDLGQPIGFPLPHWTACPRPPRSAMEGCFCIVGPVDPARLLVCELSADAFANVSGPIRPDRDAQ